MTTPLLYLTARTEVPVTMGDWVCVMGVEWMELWLWGR
jgi:hypothetical protein